MAYMGRLCQREIPNQLQLVGFEVVVLSCPVGGTHEFNYVAKIGLELMILLLVLPDC